MKPTSNTKNDCHGKILVKWNDTSEGNEHYVRSADLRTVHKGEKLTGGVAVYMKRGRTKWMGRVSHANE